MDRIRGFIQQRVLTAGGFGAASLAFQRRVLDSGPQGTFGQADEPNFPSAASGLKAIGCDSQKEGEKESVWDYTQFLVTRLKVRDKFPHSFFLVNRNWQALTLRVKKANFYQYFRKSFVRRPSLQN